MLFLEFKGQNLDSTVNLPSTYDPALRTGTVQNTSAPSLYYWN
jgi:hypothetical protein